MLGKFLIPGCNVFLLKSKDLVFFVLVLTFGIAGCGGSSSGGGESISFGTYEESTLQLSGSYSPCAIPKSANVSLKIESRGGELVTLVNEESADPLFFNVSSEVVSPFSLRAILDNKTHVLVGVPHGHYSFHREKAPVNIDDYPIQGCECGYKTIVVENGSEATFLSLGDTQTEMRCNEITDNCVQSIEVCEPDLNNVFIYDFSQGLYEKLNLTLNDDEFVISMSKEMDVASLDNRNTSTPSYTGYVSHNVFGNYYGKVSKRPYISTHSSGLPFIPSEDLPLHSVFAGFSGSDLDGNPLVVVSSNLDGYELPNNISTGVAKSGYHNTLSSSSNVYLSKPNLSTINISIENDGMYFSGLSRNSFDVLIVNISGYISVDPENPNHTEYVDYSYYMDASSDELIFDEWVDDWDSLDHSVQFSFIDYESVSGFDDAIRYIFSDEEKTSDFYSLGAFF